jgi:hypothetical protein
MNACWAIPDGRIVLRIGVSDEPLDCFGGFTLIEHQIVEGLRVPLITFSLIVHRSPRVSTSNLDFLNLGLVPSPQLNFL